MEGNQSQEDGKRPRPEDDEERRRQSESATVSISASPEDTSPGGDGSGAGGAGAGASQSGRGCRDGTGTGSEVRYNAVTTNASASSGPVIPLADRIQQLRVTGDAAFKEQLHDHAVECYTQALKLAGPWTERSLRASLSCNRATAYLALKCYEQAKDDAKEALALELTWAKAHYCLGMAMHGLHNVEASNKSFAQVVKLKPDIRIKLPTGAWFGAGADEYVPAQDFVTPSVAVQPIAPALPNGWVARESRQHPGHFFFVETKTGRSTWEQPRVKRPRFAKPIPSTRAFF